MRDGNYERNRENSICWNLTFKCNDKCSFCFVNLNSCAELSLDENWKVFKRLISRHNIQKISFSGGDPLLYPHIFDLAKKIKSNSDISLSLVSNAIKLDDEALEQVAKYFDCISFSVDAVGDDLEHKAGRNKNHYSRINSVLKKIESRPDLKELNVKINSMVSAMNIENILEVYAAVINKYNCIKRWKIFRFAPLRGMGEKNAALFNISDDEWDCVKRQIITNVQHETARQIEFTGKDIDDYLILDPDGTLKISNFESDRVIDNLLEK